VRKMYKCEIREEFIEPTEDRTISQNELGGILYYIFRPLMASVFGFLFFIACYAQLAFISPGQSRDLENFSSFVILSAFIVGYSVGDLIDKFETLSRKRIDHIVVKIASRISKSGGKDEE